MLADQRYGYMLTVTNHAFRYLLVCEATVWLPHANLLLSGKPDRKWNLGSAPDFHDRKRVRGRNCLLSDSLFKDGGESEYPAHRFLTCTTLGNIPNAHNAEEIMEVATTYFWVRFIIQY